MKTQGASYRFDLRLGKERFYVGIYNATRLKVVLNALRPGTGLVLTKEGDVAMEFASPVSAVQWIDKQSAEPAPVAAPNKAA